MVAGARGGGWRGVGEFEAEGGIRNERRGQKTGLERMAA